MLELSKSFWAEALSTAVYLRNRSPTKAVEGKTLYEAIHGEKPKVAHLRVFGCTAYSHSHKTKDGSWMTKLKNVSFWVIPSTERGTDCMIRGTVRWFIVVM